MVEQILRVLNNTVFKLRPELAADLQPEELYTVQAGTTYEIANYAYAGVNGDFNGHIKFALKNTSIRGLNTWYVYRLDAQVEFDGEVVYPREDQEALPILRINQNTLFKTRPVDSDQLAADEKAEVTRGQNFRLNSYAYADAQGDFSNHVKFALRDQKDFIRGRNTWFAYDQHIYIEFDGEIVYPPEPADLPILRITENTVFKRRPIAQSSLPANEVAPASDGSLYKLLSYAYADASGDFNNHIKVTFRYEKDYIRGLSTWYVYDRHARVERAGKIVYPQPRPTPSPSPTPTPTPIYSGKAFKLPGNVSTFYTDQPIIPGGSFTWGEATKEATRIPANEDIVDSIIALARQLQRARNQIGRPFIINSWYRPPRINQAVGGVSNSQHLYGRAADIQVPGFSGRRVANAVMSWWPGGIGIYSHLPNVVHLDVGRRRTWGI